MFFQLTRTKWAVIFALMGMSVLGLSDNIRGPLFPELLKFFNLTNSQGSLSFTFVSAAAFLGNTLGVYALRKIQLNHLLAISIFFIAIGLFAMGVVPAFDLYLLGAIIYGGGLGAAGVAQNLLIAENTEPHHQTRALSALHGLYGLSSLIAPLLASRAPSWFLEHFGGSSHLSQWRSSFFITAMLAVIILLLILSTRPQPKFLSHLQHNESVHGKKSPIITLLWFGGFFASYVGAEILVSTRLALYLRTYFNMNLEQSSDYVAAFFIFLFISRVIFVFRTFEMNLKTQLNLSLGFSLFSLILGLWINPFFLSVIGLTMGPFYPLAIVYISKVTGHQKRRFLTFVMGLQSFFVIFMHTGVGYLTDKYGLFYSFFVGIFLLIGSITCLNLHPKITT